MDEATMMSSTGLGVWLYKKHLLKSTFRFVHGYLDVHSYIAMRMAWKMIQTPYSSKPLSIKL